ncbi:hypothetical protein JAAARDRAFT_37524 [Jaapia argillacea MUCL 33604]|uniref:Uncharacterized protein n=1 Tax=Jaapia argillacea MUCL 33604 TaxID=933084 RepID=A0A067PYT5_9AGAM|nr:hypothetical protein JAAARDRAFT_37524 [Jaapia argillacea MUCL 33604]
MTSRRSNGEEVRVGGEFVESPTNETGDETTSGESQLPNPKVTSLLHAYGSFRGWQTEPSSTHQNQGSEGPIVEFFRLFHDVISSDTDRQDIPSLLGEDATVFLEFLFQIMKVWSMFKMWTQTDDLRTQIHRLVVKLSRKSSLVPQSLAITGVEILRENHVYGGFGIIHLGSYLGQKVAVKQLRVAVKNQPVQQQKHQRRFCQEALIWCSLEHPNILPLLGVDFVTFGSYPAMISPWMENGNILDYIDSRDLQVSQVDNMLFEISKGLEYLHDRYIVHGDLRGMNILVDPQGHALVADFGLSIIPEITLSASPSKAGCTRWNAPELVDWTRRGSRSYATDVYSLAMVALEIYTRDVPFAHLENDMAVALSILANNRPNRSEVGGAMSDEIWALVQDCWAQGPSDRPTITQICERLSALDHSPEQPISRSLTPRPPTAFQPTVIVEPDRHIERTILNEDTLDSPTVTILTFSASDPPPGDRRTQHSVSEEEEETLLSFPFDPPMNQDPTPSSERTTTPVPTPSVSEPPTTSSPAAPVSPTPTAAPRPRRQSDPGLHTGSGSSGGGITPPITPARSEPSLPPPEYSPPPSPSDIRIVFLPLVNQIAAQKRIEVKYADVFSGPPHAPIWSVKCNIDGRDVGEGRGVTKQGAKETAAKQAYYALNWNHCALPNGQGSGLLQNQPFLPRFNQMAAQRRHEVEWLPTNSGPPHALRWFITCSVDGHPMGYGQGLTKQAAKEDAAEQAFSAMGWSTRED